MPERENLVVLRTFSKWAGLAGLRVGYGAFPAWLMPVLWKAKQPYNVNVAATEAALASLADLRLPGGQCGPPARRTRSAVLDLLAGVPYLRPCPSEANFILCQVEGRSARELKDDPGMPKACWCVTTTRPCCATTSGSAWAARKIPTAGHRRLKRRATLGSRTA